ncbi:MAG: LptA/OstA family protein, partial [Elusimicrobiota bacterium]
MNITLISFSYPLEGSGIKIKADKMVYSETTKKINAEGNVQISSGDIIIVGGRIETDLNANYVIATDSVAIYENESYVTGETLEYSFDTSTGVIYNAKGSYSDWYFTSQRAYKDKKAFRLKKSK